MWPLGHVAIGFLAYLAVHRARNREDIDEIAVLLAVIGSLAPDIIDKPLAWHLGVLPTGRTLAHSLLVIVPVCLVAYVLASRSGHPEWGVGLTVGALSHLIVDALPVLWDPEASGSFLLWPVWSVEEYQDGAPTVTALLVEQLGDPYFLIEFPLFAIAVVCWYRLGMPGVRPLVAAWRSRTRD